MTMTITATDVHNSRNSLFYIFWFLTTWAFILVFFHEYTHKYINLSLLTTITIIGGLYLSWVHPRRYSFWLQGHEIQLNHPIERFVIADMLFHLTTFAFIHFKYGTYFTPQSVITLLILIIIYKTIVPVEEVYQTSEHNIVIIFVISTLLWFAVTFSK